MAHGSPGWASMSDDHWFIAVSHDWSWTRRAWFVASWPLWYAWARIRMKWYRLWHRDIDWIQDYRAARNAAWWERWDE